MRLLGESHTLYAFTTMQRNTNYYGSYSEFLETRRRSHHLLEQNALLTQTAFDSYTDQEMEGLRVFTPSSSQSEDDVRRMIKQLGRSFVSRLQKPFVRPKITFTLDYTNAYSIELKKYKAQ